MMADSRSFVGASWLLMISASWVSRQLSFEVMSAPFDACSSRVGLTSGLGTPNCCKEGPMARMMILFVGSSRDDEAANHDVVAMSPRGSVRRYSSF